MINTAQAKPKKRKRRSPEFMANVRRLMDCEYTFFHAVLTTEATQGEWEYRENEKSRETMRWENQLATWNASVPIGTPVMYRHVVGGPETASKTRSEAWALGHGQPVVKIDGESGGWNLDFVRVVTP